MKRRRSNIIWTVEILIAGEWRGHKDFKYAEAAKRMLRRLAECNVKARIKHPCGEIAWAFNY